MPVVSRPQRAEAIQARYNVTVDFPRLGLHSAAATGNLGLVKYALDHGQPINSVLDGVLPLHAACSGGNDVVVRLLIEKGADVNAPRLPRRYSSDKNRDGSAPIVGTSGSTPLHFACANGHTPVVLTLLMHGAHADRADKHGTTPETLARQNGWVACADVLRNWTLNKDKDLREKEAFIPFTQVDTGLSGEAKHACSGNDCRVCLSKRVRVKRSIDHALNMLKPSLSQLHPSGFGDNAGPTLETIVASPLLPSEPTDDSIAQANSEANTVPESLARRPSLPNVFDSAETMPISRRPNESGTSSRRPRSAGTDAEPPPASRRVRGKVSLLNIFKKGDAPSATEGSSDYASTSYIPRSDSALGLVAPNLPNRIGMHFLASSSSSPLNSRHSDLTVPGRPRGRVFSEGESTRVPPLPTAVDLHRALSDERARTLSSHNPADVQLLDSNAPSSAPGHRSPSMRPGILRPHNRSISGQSQGESPRSGSVGPPSARSLRFESSSAAATSVWSNDTCGPPSRSPARGPKMTRSVSSMRSVVGAEGSRSPLRVAPEIDGNTHGGEVVAESDNVDEEDEEEYGVPVVSDQAITELDSRLNALQVTEDCKRNSVLSQLSLSPLPSPNVVVPSPDFDCPFSINRPPPDDLESPTRQNFLDAHGTENRMRGDSMSSMSTNGTSGYLPTPGTQHLQLPSPCISSSTSTPPEYPSMDQGGCRIRRAPSSSNTSEVETAHKHKVPPSALEINVGSISSYAQAEALVQRAQQSILEMQDVEVEQQLTSGAGQTPLSAALAAYGESLAIERKFRQEEEEKRSNSSTPRSFRPSDASERPPLDQSESTSGPRLDRKFSLEERSHHTRTIRQSKVRRPHTAGSTTSSDVVASPPRQSGSPRTVPASGPQLSERTNSDHRMVDVTSSLTPPMSSLFKTDADRPRVPRSRTPDPCCDDPLDRSLAVGVPLSRISTAPVQDLYLKPKRGLTDQERQAARATKLVKMGFSNADTLVAAGANRSSPAGRPRFGGFKGFVQSLTGK